MSFKKANEKRQVTKKMVRITMEAKKEIVENYEDGMCIRDLAVAYRMPRTTVSTIVKNKEAIKSANVAKGVKSITKQRSETLEDVETLLLIWITEQQCAGDSVSQAKICEKAKLIHANLLKNKAGTSEEVFKASHGWFNNFKKRSGFQNIAKNGKGANADKDVANNFIKEFEHFIKTGSFVPQHVFNSNEPGLFWKKMDVDMSDNDVEDLIQRRKEKLTTENLQKLEKDEHKTKRATLSSGSDEEEVEEVPTSLIKEIFTKWMDVRNFAEKYHPNKAQTSHNSNVWNDQTMSYFRNILKRRQKKNDK